MAQAVRARDAEKNSKRVTRDSVRASRDSDRTSLFAPAEAIEASASQFGGLPSPSTKPFSFGAAIKEEDSSGEVLETQTSCVSAKEVQASNPTSQSLLGKSQPKLGASFVFGNTASTRGSSQANESLEVPWNEQQSAAPKDSLIGSRAVPRAPATESKPMEAGRRVLREPNIFAGHDITCFCARVAPCTDCIALCCW